MHRCAFSLSGYQWALNHFYTKSSISSRLNKIHRMNTLSNVSNIDAYDCCMKWFVFVECIFCAKCHVIHLNCGINDDKLNDMSIHFLWLGTFFARQICLIYSTRRLVLTFDEKSLDKKQLFTAKLLVEFNLKLHRKSHKEMAYDWVALEQPW